MERKLTERQKPIIDYDTIIEATAILIGDYSSIRKQAAVILLKYALGLKFFKFLLADNEIYPFKREDFRVREWTKTILAMGKCEVCGSTENLEAHHVVRWADYPQGRIDIKNGQCLCVACHAQEYINEKAYYMMISRMNARLIAVNNRGS